jgi:ABC-type lipoprotein release transport system permease subunit
VIGLAVSMAAARLLHSQLFGVRVGDITMILPLVGAATLIVAIAATLPAAWSAAQADPLVAMRSE